MGNKQAAEIDCQRIAEIATEANGQFSKEFATAYKDAVADKIKKAYTDQGAVPQALRQADVPNKHIKSGFLIKMGANVRSWKRRFFIAHNESDNFAVSYSEDASGMTEKGKFYCWGYEVESFQPEEVTKYGWYGIKLRPRDASKREWLFRAENEVEQTQWMEVFVNACKKSKAGPVKDTVMLDAFRAAYRSTRTSYGYFGVFHLAGTECDMLEYLTNQILSREVLDNFLVEQASSSSRSSTVATRKSTAKNLNTTVQKVVKPIVASSWRASQTAAESSRASYELSVKASLRTLLDKEKVIKTFLEGKIRVLVDPYIPDFQTNTCLPILKSCFEDIVQAYEQALVGFHTEVKTIIGSEEHFKPSMKASFAVLRDSIEEVQSNALDGAQRILWKLHTVDLESVYDVLERAGLSGYDIYISTMTDLRKLVQNALYTFCSQTDPGSSIKNNKRSSTSNSSSSNDANSSTIVTGGASSSFPSPPRPIAGGAASTQIPSVPPSHNGAETSVETAGAEEGPGPVPLLVEVLNEVISKLTADAKISLQLGLSKLLLDALEAQTQEYIIAPCYEVVLVAENLVTRETQHMVNLYSIGENMVREMVRMYVNTLIDELVAEASSRLNMVAVQLLNDVSKK